MTDPSIHDTVINSWKNAVKIKYPKANRWMIFKNGRYLKRRYVPPRGSGRKRKILIDRLSKREVLAEIAFYERCAA